MRAGNPAHGFITGTTAPPRVHYFRIPRLRHGSHQVRRDTETSSADSDALLRQAQAGSQLGNQCATGRIGISIEQADCFLRSTQHTREWRKRTLVQ